MLFAADVHKDALIGLGVALLPGVALNDGVLTLVERAGQLGIFRDLCRQLVLQRLQLLLLGAMETWFLTSPTNIAALTMTSTGSTTHCTRNWVRDSPLRFLIWDAPFQDMHITTYG